MFDRKVFVEGCNQKMSTWKELASNMQHLLLWIYDSGFAGDPKLSITKSSSMVSCLLRRDALRIGCFRIRSVSCSDSLGCSIEVMLGY